MIGINHEWNFWAFVSGTWKFLFILFFIFKLPISTVITHYYTFLFHLSFLVYGFWGGHLIEDPRGRFCQSFYTEVPILFILKETECRRKRRNHVFLRYFPTRFPFSSSVDGFNFY